ncbi:hypothetical protein AD53_00360 [Campylobacter jejuni]|uniref:Uncharacterized protein n=2 Tax=Campylobacter jejuni TaxID=197 RepID=Q0PC63_CAMJE|nr:hypothetical protein N565_01830 [Campylobacter jejuni subsp. jejuni 00-2538]AIR73290.1 hypothetical protein N564_01800 [Campylobacter jejuni subsp. jejuni 00-2426]AIR73372.1 hypothetical protein N755_01835 [Campylobacter jejuni subsp. jejuni 00-2544]AIR73531.1 hypothetical protein N135_01850 [Campylobacter jejuni subsp. jejuni 00-2425]AJK70260.1 hypothetical protein PJ17_00365 [Campylobacter jejuni subsp. jejuni]ALJ16835.1 hypothetical protein AOD58_00355 [Campylobacter jejuni]KQI39639.1 h
MDKFDYSYPILTKDTKCSFCENFFSIEYSSNLKTIEKECPFYNNKMDIKLKD